MKTHLGYLILNLFSLTLCHGFVNAPYQVGIFLFDNFNPSFPSKNFAVCSAAIIHPLFCVTTADCVHAHITSQNIARPFLPSSIYIKSGNFSEIRENIKYVKAIYIHPDFNSSTFENDIALIQVESSFQFIHPFNERWVQLPDYATNYAKCIYSISTPNLGLTEIYPFGEPTQTRIIHNSMCHGNLTSYYLPHIKSVDLCSFYQFDHSFMCQIPESQLRLNRDRGTPLICDNKLAGLLSVIIPSNVTNSTFCTESLKTHAYYTKVVDYTKWIHSVIGINTPEHTADGQPIPIVPVSPPYQNILSVAHPMGFNAATPSKSGSIVFIIVTYFVVTFFIVTFFGN